MTVAPRYDFFQLEQIWYRLNWYKKKYQLSGDVRIFMKPKHDLSAD